MNSHHGLKITALFYICFLLSGCLSNTSYAPVVNAGQQLGAKPGTYIVHKGDTVYSIAWNFGLDYRVLAAANGLNPPYKIRPGQRLRMMPPPRRTYAARKPKPRYIKKNERVVKIYTAKRIPRPTSVPPEWSSKAITRWVWPARGRVVLGFSSKLSGNRGIDIAGRLGETVRAASPGTVVYSGDGVRGYGNLLIIKHNDSFLSAYAFNKKLLVKLGQRVRAGQPVAKMGRNNAGRVMLHFEIRRNGRPVNPRRYLRS